MLLLAGALLVGAHADDSEDVPEEDAPEESGETDAEAEARAAERTAKNRAAAMAMMDAAGPNGWLERGWRADLNVDLGGGNPWADDWIWFGRGRVGIMRVAEPTYLTLGVTAEHLWPLPQPTAIGLELEAMEMVSAIQLIGGGGLDLSANWRWHLGLGWQIFGVEVNFSGSDRLVMGKIRIPISWFVYAIKES